MSVPCMRAFALPSSKPAEQRDRVGPGRYIFLPDRAPETRRAAAFHGIRAGVVPSACSGMELWLDGALEAMRAAPFRWVPTFGPTCFRTAVA